MGERWVGPAEMSASLGMSAKALRVHERAWPVALSGPLDVPAWLADAPGRVVVTVMGPVEVPGQFVRANVTLDKGPLYRLDSAAAARTSRSGVCCGGGTGAAKARAGGGLKAQGGVQ